MTKNKPITVLTFLSESLAVYNNNYRYIMLAFSINFLVPGSLPYPKESPENFNPWFKDLLTIHEKYKRCCFLSVFKSDKTWQSF